MDTPSEKVQEVSTEENEAIVGIIYNQVVALTALGTSIPAYQRIIYDVYYLWLEAGSGASYEQYFRWASVQEISRVVSALRQVGLLDIATLTEDAIAVAFPRGIPASHEEKSDLTDWTSDQERELESLFTIFEKSNGRIINVLGRYAIRFGWEHLTEA